MRRPLPLEEMTEQEFDGLLFRGAKSTARTLGWTSYHTLRSRGSLPGFPDRTCWRERVLFVETKGMKTPIAAEQRNCLDALARAGAEVYLWRPTDYEEAGLVLARRWDFRPYFAGVRPYPYFARNQDGRWTPRAAWIPGVGRADTLPNYAEIAGSP